MQRSLAFMVDLSLETVRARLQAILGPQRQADADRLDPMSQLVKASISGRTRDRVAESAFARLRRRFPDWALLGAAAPRTIEAIIRPVTHADAKAVHLRAAIRMIRARTGDLDLAFLADWDEEAAMQWLDGLPGVGPKVAATVLNFSTLRKRVLAVDTHLLRVGTRLGWLPPNADYASGFALMARRLPATWDADALFEMHWLLKYLGQHVCTHHAPACARCPLSDLCPQARHRTGEGLVGPAGLEPATTPL